MSRTTRLASAPRVAMAGSRRLQDNLIASRVPADEQAQVQYEEATTDLAAANVGWPRLARARILVRPPWAHHRKREPSDGPIA